MSLNLGINELALTVNPANNWWAYMIVIEWPQL
jgi:hypothetical protein